MNKLKNRPLLILIITIILVVVGIFITAVRRGADKDKKQNSELDLESFPQISISSENLHNGRWDDVISNTNLGKCQSPQLQWAAVADAAYYAVLMIDPDGNNWLHFSALTDKTSLETGEYSGAEQGYVGPYPPSGTHNYVVYVFALRESTLSLDTDVDAAGADIDEIATELNQGKSQDNNILAVGELSGTYSAER
jgi:phosphatidylethanolamine-binding protein (PEBP) family uncharacterized protein